MKVTLSAEEVEQAILKYTNTRAQGPWNRVRMKYSTISEVEVTYEEPKVQEEDDAAQ